MMTKRGHTVIAGRPVRKDFADKSYLRQRKPWPTALLWVLLLIVLCAGLSSIYLMGPR